MTYKKTIVTATVILTTFLLGGCSLLGQKPETSEPVETVVPSSDLVATDSAETNELIEVVDEVKDGVYTNYTYGFRFEYDDQVFTENIPWQRNRDKKQFAGEEWNEQLTIRVSISEYDLNSFSRCSNSEVSSEILICSITNERSLVQDSESAMENGEDYGYSKQFAFKKVNDDQLFIFSILMPHEKENLAVSLFDQVRNSFEIISK